MITQEKERNVKVSVGESADFTIKATGKAFKILIDGLYSDKPGSVTREIWSNALDSHIAAGKPELPFEVTFPSLFNKEFRVRDFGTGLSHEDVMGLYSTVFESTKEDSADATGCLGLGSKAPFSYTDTFSVTSWFNGMKRMYSAVIGPTGTPTINFMFEEPTSKPNGLEVSFPVEADDIADFAKAADRISLGFKVKPICKPERPWPELIESVRGNGYRIVERNSSLGIDGADLFVQMGPVLYPVPKTDDIDWSNSVVQTSKSYHQIAILDVPMGSVAFTASRESLSFGKEEPTRDTLRSVIRDIDKNFAKDAVESINKTEYLIDANLILAKLSWRTRKDINHFVANHHRQNNGNKMLVDDKVGTKWGDQLGMSMTKAFGDTKRLGVVRRDWGSARVNASFSWSNDDGDMIGQLERTTVMDGDKPETKNVVFVQIGDNNSKERNNKRVSRRVMAEMRRLNIRRTLFFREAPEDEGTKTLADLKGFLPKDTMYIMVDELPDDQLSKKGRTKVKIKKLRNNGSWQGNVVSLDEEQMEAGGIYATSYGHDLEGDFTRKAAREGYSIASPILNNTTVYVVPRTHLSKFEGRPQWVLLEDILEMEIGPYVRDVVIWRIAQNQSYAWNRCVDEQPPAFREISEREVARLKARRTPEVDKYQRLVPFNASKTFRTKKGPYSRFLTHIDPEINRRYPLLRRLNHATTDEERQEYFALVDHFNKGKLV